LKFISEWENTDWRQRYEQQHTRESLAWRRNSCCHLPNYAKNWSCYGKHWIGWQFKVFQTTLIVVLAMEAAEETAAEKAAILQTEYSHCFLRMLRPFIHAAFPAISSEICQPNVGAA